MPYYQDGQGRDRMGFQNVSTTFARWGHLPDRSFRLLVFMALRSLDTDAPPRYFGGREELSMALGRMTPAEPAPGDSSARAARIRTLRKADFQAVKTAFHPLLRMGVVATEKNPGPGRHAVYSLHLDLATGYEVRSEQGTKSVLDGVRSSYPVGGGRGGDLGKQEDKGEVKDSPKVTTSLAIVPEYEEARIYLNGLAGFGAAFMERVTEPEMSTQEIVIRAATLARSERKTS